MRQFIAEQNVRHFERILETEVDAKNRIVVRELLAEAQRELALIEAEMFGAAVRPAPSASDRAPPHRARASALSLFRDSFEATDQPLRLVDPRPGLHVVDVNDAYKTATLVSREQVCGEKLFDAFPDNPTDAFADGVSNLFRSLCRAAETGLPDTMPIQRYDVRASDGTFVVKYWRPVNTPIFDANRRLLHIVHHVEDVTEGCLRAAQMARPMADVLQLFT